MSAPSPFHKYTAAFVAIAMLGSSAAGAATTAAPRVVLARRLHPRGSPRSPAATRGVGSGATSASMISRMA